MQLLTSIFLFILGSCIGSFLGLVVARFPRGRNIFSGRSECDSCHKKIPFYDLFPVVSYLVLGGKCRYCKKKIPLQVLLIEIVSGSLFVLAYLFTFSSIISFIITLFIIASLILISFIDLDSGIIPDSILITTGILGLLLLFYTSSNLVSHLITSIVSFSFLFLIFALTRGRGIGFGDVKLAFVMGILLSWQELIVAYYIAFLTGALISIILVVIGKRKMRGSTIAFGPFLSLGTVSAMLFGPEILNAVRQILGF